MAGLFLFLTFKQNLSSFKAKMYYFMFNYNFRDYEKRENVCLSGYRSWK